jgi:hypothetical protein
MSGLLSILPFPGLWLVLRSWFVSAGMNYSALLMLCALWIMGHTRLLLSFTTVMKKGLSGAYDHGGAGSADRVPTGSCTSSGRLARTSCPAVEAPVLDSATERV